MSLAMRALRLYMRLFWKSANGNERAQSYRGRTSSTRPSFQIPSMSGISVTKRMFGNFSSLTFSPPGHGRGRAVLYIHGGSFTNEIGGLHWPLIAKLASAGVVVEVPIYGLAPEHSFEAAYSLLQTVYMDMLRAHGPDSITVMGDSAGGGLALGLAMSLRQLRMPKPRSLTLITPWLDLRCSNPAIQAYEKADPWLTRSELSGAAKLWARGTDLKDPRLSPLYGDLSNLPPIDVYAGTRDIMFPDILLLRSSCAASGIPVNVEICDGGCHVYPLFRVPEGKAAAARIVRRLST